jgi:hypothetical protein
VPGSAATAAWGHRAGGRDVDFVVVGFGLGALGVLLGVVMLGWLAPRSQHAALRVSSPDDAARHRALAAERHGTGQTFLYAGGALLLVTVAGLVSSLDDRTGAFLVTTTATVAAIGIILAGYLQRIRNPMPSRRRTRSAPMAGASTVTAPPPADTPSFLADEPPWVQDPERAEAGLQEPPTDVLPATASDGEAIIVAEMASPAAGGCGSFSSGATNPSQLDDSPIATETPDSGSRQLADHAAVNRSDDTDLAETEDAMDAGSVAPTTYVTESSPSRPDDDDPSSGHS